MSKRIVYILNPKASDERGRELWEKARQKYSYLPEHPYSITDIPDITTWIKKEKPDIIAIAGGDGTINKIAQAILPLQEKPVLSIIPMGTGNALSYCLGVETLEKALFVLKEQPKSIAIDIMESNIPELPIGIFNISVGFDARIVFNRVNYRYIGLKSYILSGVRSLFSHPEREITFTIDKKITLKATASSLVVANCPVIGQNLVISPRAKLNDGLLDCTLFSTKYAYVTNLRLRGFKHPFYSEIGKVHFKASHLLIQGEPFVQIDGDPVVRQEGIEIVVVPKKITFLRNHANQIDQYYAPFVV